MITKNAFVKTSDACFQACLEPPSEQLWMKRHGTRDNRFSAVAGSML